ncbi:phage tail tape measure protein [Caldalkalibacillus mannanilyticus]|uniref:phage tail tape measure protein n=1 Tax=Caldalkalibacillus mannanilyticus TaxID=1418 RepID=UPI00046954F3|nr:phage tail tape measure protein [Caldalkalibacillus mannanilyticus]
MNSIDVGSIRAKLELDAKNYSQSIEKAKGKTKELESSAKDTESSIKKLGVAFAGLTLAMGGVITASVKTAAQFESSMARVKAITQANVMEFDALRKKAEELGASTVFSASQTAEGMSYLAMAGFNVQEIISAMPGVLNLAAAGQMELARTADIASNILTGFKIEAGETSRVVDVLAKTMTSSNTNIEQLGYAMKYVAPIASNAGLSLEETAAAVGKLSDAGIQGEMAGTTLRAILLRLISPSAEAAKLMNELGFSITDANGKMLELPQIISNAERAFSGLTETQRLEYAATIAGTEAASGFLTLLSTEESTLAEFTSQLQDSAGAAQEMADIQNNTLNGSIAAFKSALEAAGIAVGDKFAPAIREVTSILTSLAKGFADLNTPAQNAIITFSMLVPLVGSLVFGIRALSTALMALKLTIPVFAAISLAVGGLAAGLSYLSSKQREVEEQERKTREETNRLSKEYDDLARKTSDLADDSQEAIDAKKRMAEVFERIKEINPDVVSAYNSQTSAIRSMTGATREATKAKIDDLKATLALLKAQDAQGDGGSIGLGKSLVSRKLSRKSRS